MNSITSPALDKDVEQQRIPRKSIWWSSTFWGYLLIAAPMIGFALWVLGPMVASLVLSFFDWNLISSPKFVGLENWATLISGDPTFWIAVQNTLYFLISIPITMAISLLLALALNLKIPFAKWFRVIYFLPAVSSLAAISLLWQWILNPDYGLLNQWLQEMGLHNGPNWLGDANLVKPALIIMLVWLGVGYNMILYQSGLQSIPSTLLEAASIDGANRWQRFWYITWPLLTPTTFFILVTGIIGTLQLFIQIYIITQGGPDMGSTTYMFSIWNNAFTYQKMGYASAEAWFLAIVIMIATAINFLIARKWVQYDLS